MLEEYVYFIYLFTLINPINVQFRHFANKVGNLERPFLKEFFPRWVGSCGCPVLRSDLCDLEIVFSFSSWGNIC